ncbi:unnamed protein product [Gongylonema pulchrum]|uniref:Cadherin domain-containing protein n=1 Tax=Gongylonema pulchrum TaxID=637853 RepID=A0A3P6RJE6_9BILA|nr:unnamed protein product [Gongylonema pulchrum]
MKYDLYAVYGGRIPFGVRTDSGALFVKEPLDYEKENVYHMKLFVTDGKHNATTDLYVYVDDVNDNAPVFEKNLYEITISEEDYNVPKTLFIVKATDADKVRKIFRNPQSHFWTVPSMNLKSNFFYKAHFMRNGGILVSSMIALCQ